MKNRANKRFISFLKAALGCVLTAAAVVCVACRLPVCFDSQDSAVAAAAFTLTNGQYRSNAESDGQTEPTSETVTQADTVSKTTGEETVSESSQSSASSDTERDKSGYYDSYASHDGEAKYTVEERSIGGSGTAVENFYVKNKTGLEFDFEGLLNADLPFNVNKGVNSPQVLIYHTHTSEAYLDEDVDFFYESFYSRTNDNSFNVVAVGNAIADALNAKGIQTVHDTAIHDASYNGSYDRSAQTVYDNLEKYPDIKVVIDIHRDAIGTEENKVKPTFTYNGKKGAQIMILSGCDCYGERDFDDWEQNLSFALKIQHTAETLYPGITRPMSFDFFAYNEYICPGSLLIEVGCEANSIDEAVYSGELLGNALAQVLT